MEEVANAASNRPKKAPAASTVALRKPTIQPSPGPSAWGKTGGGPGTANKPTKTLSLAEIQAEERAKVNARSQGSQGGRISMAERIASATGSNRAHYQTQSSGTSGAGAGAWGSGRSSSKSISQIQADEVKKASAIKSRAAPSGSGWAAKAGAQQARAVASRVKAKAPSSMPPPRTQKGSNDMFWGYEDDKTNTRKSQQTATQPTRSAKTVSKQTSAADFGGSKLSAPMESWAKSELLKIRGNADLTIVHFCMSEDIGNADVRGYMAEVLGSTPAVSSFASEFLRRKHQLIKSRGTSGKKKRKGKK